ncbi:MAG: hypothetical protein QM622_10290 [Microbacterium sp.]
MIGVWTTLPAYRAVAAELPLSTRSADSPAGAVVVVGGGGGSDIAAAAAVVLVDPVPGAAPTVPDGPPVIVDRVWLRSDVAAAAGICDAAVFTAECAAAAGELAGVVRDAIGWLRQLADAPLTLESVHAVGGSAMALLRAGERPATLTVRTIADRAARPRLRVLAAGASRTEVVVDGQDATVVVTTQGGAQRMPVLPESRQRLALRRALEAVALRGQGDPGDLAELRHDDQLCALVLDELHRRPVEGRQKPG